MLTNTMRDPIIEAASFFGEELMQMNAGNVLLKRTQPKKALDSFLWCEDIRYV